MSFLQLLAIGLVSIVTLIIFFSNLNPVLPLVFLGRSTVPLPLGLLFLGAMGAGVITSLVIRLLMFWQRSTKDKRRPAEPAEFSYQSAPPPIDDWASERPDFDQPRDRQDAGYERPSPEPPEQFRAPEPEPFIREKDAAPPTNDYVYDADYRVISQPNDGKHPTPIVDSKLSPDSEDWGFDFEDEEERKR